MKKINKKTKLSEVFKINEKATEVFLKKGLACMGCPMAMNETVEQGCKEHGMSDKEIEELLKKINKTEKNKK